MFHSDRSKATIIEARENVYGHAGRITTCFLTLGHRRLKNLCYFSLSNESSLLKMPQQFQSHTGAQAHSKLAKQLWHSQRHQSHVFAREAPGVGFLRTWHCAGREVTAFPLPRATSCVQHSITPLLPHCWQ